MAFMLCLMEMCVINKVDWFVRKCYGIYKLDMGVRCLKVFQRRVYECWRACGGEGLVCRR